MKTSSPQLFGRGLLASLLLAAFCLAADDAPESPLGKARRLYQQGVYAEALDAYQALPADDAVSAAIGMARCQEATGDRDKALATLSAAAEKQPRAAVLPAELARLALVRGDRTAGMKRVGTALELEPDNVLALWVRAEFYADAGELTKAKADYQALVKRYNDHDIKNPDDLHRIGLAAAEAARWNRQSDQFSFLVNEFYPDLLALDATFWQAQYESGRLFAEKYNFSEASKAFKAALAINPNATEVEVALGELALNEFELRTAEAASQRAAEINPQLLGALLLRADIYLTNFEPRGAVGVLQDALKLEPHSEESLGRLAAAYLAVDGPAHSGPDTRFGKLVGEVNGRNPHAGRFYTALGDALDRLRRWPAAAHYYEEARTRMPELPEPAGRLGMILMRLGDEERAKKVLDESFEIDPFNVRVNNTLKVLEVLDGYATHETEHFRIKYDKDKDAILARYMGEWLEEVYPQLVKQMGFAPPEKSLFEVFSKAKNTDGHGWFSARMVGLPHIHPIGACAGKIVALQSPSEGPQRFNWSRVLKHEFVHVINLQQTDFNIPHWFTEALAVLNEGYPRPQAWSDLLVARSAAGKLYDLDTINVGFIRPLSSDDWTLAYCQAELYARYMLDRFGDQAIAKMLAAYGDNLTTSEAVERALGTSKADFEDGYSAYLKKLIDALPAAAKQREMTLGELQKALSKTPKDPALLAKMAQAQLGRKNYPEARRWTDAALAIEPRQALACYVRARLHLVVGETTEAIKRLEEGLDRNEPQENVLALLAALKLKAEDYPAATELYELGAASDPTNNKWQKSLAAVYLRSGDKRLADVLTKIASTDADDAAVRKKLAQLALESGDHAAASRWALEALRINVMDTELHRWRGQALAALEKPSAAADEYATAVELEPDDAALRIALARSYEAAGDRGKARAAVEALLARESDNEEGIELLEKLK